MLLSICIPTFNSEKQLYICLNSILNQRPHDFDCQIMLIDSNSTDQTYKLIQSYKSRMKISIHNVGKCSIGEARNYGIRNSDSKYIIFLDSDDALSDNRLLIDSLIINNNRTIDFIFGDSIQLVKSSKEFSYYTKSPNIPSKYIFLNIPFNLSSITISRTKIMNKKLFFLKGIEGRLGEDWKFILSITREFTMYEYSSNPRVIINSRNDSHTQNNIQANLGIATVKFLCFEYLKYFKSLPFLNRVSFSLQIQSSLLLALIKLIRFSNDRSFIRIYSSFKKHYFSYVQIPFVYLCINFLLFPYSIYLLVFKHRRSILSPLRRKLSIKEFDKYSSLL